MAQKPDYLFFTGSPQSAKLIMRQTSEALIPATLELGGKSPVIVDKDANLEIAAQRISFGKFVNCGQTCIAPDYLFVHSSVKQKFIDLFIESTKTKFTDNAFESKFYGRIINNKHFERLYGLLKNQNIIFGGESSKNDNYIAPTLIDNPDLSSPVMKEEIFGPIFPVITLNDRDKSFTDKVIEFVTSREKPLAFYYFGKEADGWEIIRRTSSGGGCINDVIMHIANENVPFGGVGNSGMGRYHDKESFNAFSHTRSIIATGNLIDLPFRYMPYNLFGLVKKIL